MSLVSTILQLGAFKPAVKEIQGRKANIVRFSLLGILCFSVFNYILLLI